MNKPRYCISYKRNDTWHDVAANTIHEARALYEMADGEFKVLYDTLNGEQIEQS